MTADDWSAIEDAARRSIGPQLPWWADGCSGEQLDRVAEGLHPTGRPLRELDGQTCGTCVGSELTNGLCWLADSDGDFRVRSRWWACDRWME